MLAFSLFFAANTFGQVTYRWTGAGDDTRWHNKNNWEVVGQPGLPTTIPKGDDDVIFDALPGDVTVYFDEVATCKTLNTQNLDPAKKLSFAFTSSSPKKIIINGSLLLNDNTVFIDNNGTGLGTVEFSSQSSGNQIYLGANTHHEVSLNFVDIGTWTVISNVHTTANIKVTQGTLNIESKNIQCNDFRSYYGDSRTINMKNSTVVVNYWVVGNTPQLTLDTEGSDLHILKGDVVRVYMGNHNYDKVTFGTTPDHTLLIEINYPNLGSAKIKQAIMKSTITHRPAIEYENLTLEPGVSLFLTSKATCTNSFTANGTCDQPIKVYTYQGTAAISTNGLFLNLPNSAAFQSNYMQVEKVVARSTTPGLLPFTLQNGLNLDEPANTGANGWTFVPPVNRDLLWVGGRGSSATYNWSDVNNWVLKNNPSQAAGCLPGPTDRVHFDQSSFVNGGDVVVDLNNAYCSDMLWDANVASAVHRPVLTQSIKDKNLYIYGSLQLAAAMDVAFTNIIELKGGVGAHTLTTAGLALKCPIRIHAEGVYTLQDNLTSESTLYFRQGTLNAINKTISVESISDGGAQDRFLISGPRAFNFSGSTLNIKDFLILGGAVSPTTVNAANSTINMFATTGAAVVGSAVDAFHDIIFHSTTDINASIHAKNTTTFHDVTIHSAKTEITGTGSYNILDLKGSVEFGQNDDRTYGDLMLTKGKAYQFDNTKGNYKIMSTHTIQRKLTAVGTCGSPIILESLTDGTPINLHFATGSTYDASYLSINEINATGDQAGFLVATEGSLDADNTYPSTGWDFTNSQPARTLYWVGDGGNWGDESHWVTRDANGAIKTTNECTPTPKDIVIFDANSFTTADQKVNMDLVVATCHSIIWKDDVKFQPEWAGENHNHILRVYGSFTTADASKMSVSYTGYVYMLGNGSIDTKGNELMMGRWVFENEQATWNLNSDWHATHVYLNGGSLKSNNYAMNLGVFTAVSEKNVSFDLGTSMVTIRGNSGSHSWKINNTQNKFTLKAAQSTIELAEGAIEMHAGTGLVYNNLTFSNNRNNGVKLSANQSSFNDVLFKSSTITVAGNNNTFRSLTLMKGGTIEGENIFDYLTLIVQANSYFLEGGKTHTVNKRLMVRGNNCTPIHWESTSASQAASIVMGTDAIAIVRYVNMQGLHITEKTPKFEAIQCADNGMNAGWNFVPLSQAIGHGFADSQTINPGEEVCLSVENFAVMEGDDFVWLKDGVEINSTSRTLCITEAGTYALKITYDNGCETQDEIVISYPVSQCPYQIGNATFSCVGDTVCVWLKAKTKVTAGIIGMDYCLQYDASVVEPITDLNLPKDRRYEFGEVVTTNGQGFERVYINYEAGQNRVYSSIYYEDIQSSTTSRYFTGSGNVFCIKFRLKTAVTGQFPITACQVSESYALGEEDKCADPGMVEVTPDVNKLKARIIYWNQEGGIRPLAYDNSGNHLITNIQGNVATCDALSVTAVNTDIQGYFVYDKTQGSHVTIKRDIPGDYNGQTGTAPDMMNIVNGMDCYYAGLITTFDQNNTKNGNSNWTPNAFQMLAADVNMNDKVRANDITLIQNRIVLKMQEYPQVWNYAYTAGNTEQQPTQAGVYSLDWRFVDEATVNTATDFNATANYPVYVGNMASDAGFWRDNAPDLTTCRPVQEGSVCDAGNTNNLFYGIMLGDVDGSWTTGVSNHLRTTKSEGTLAIDLFNAEDMGDGGYRIPVYYRGEGKLHAIDFSFEYDHSKVQVQKADYATAGTSAELNMRWNAYQNQKFLLTSYTMKGVNTQDKVYYIEVKTTDGNLDASAFQNVKAYLNGKASQSKVIATAAQQNAFAMANNTTVVTMYPNPASNVVTLSYSHLSQGIPQVVLSDLNGQKVNIQPTVDQSGKIQFGVSHVVRGLYLVTLYDEAGGVISRQKLMIKR
ncbi:hypothetical protein M23134_02144 [Microscilla marina ATCC 23134]|uniref:Uncharacterized protein n=2 Tax=Microscilla marina TaxID=1027 RepID=A1ZNC3_MICM2|nr:hypothetical protein M23134_02144 [Microscilla marina ATCC 23134]